MKTADWVFAVILGLIIGNFILTCIIKVVWNYLIVSIWTDLDPFTWAQAFLVTVVIYIARFIFSSGSKS